MNNNLNLHSTSPANNLLVEPEHKGMGLVASRDLTQDECDLLGLSNLDGTWTLLLT